ncbi:hypothetical protein L917_18549 [Phytophthora nicotianae]|uniref:Uncharacterized protein n=2 Tax=Phytophthora nicotianae TaxID=4792 RepID=V9E4J9_PHYNI|nr:hypothetical protein F443_19408 [Phytophthora nicotianae P1569]ETL27802.1 hypothetical protein L916_18724 [Phytophthora nicotianae]ETL81048.1 hypothetical protein L917_18549 [Phytophthora nicotianae]ETM34239.1 hypothetical protein L914_18644 [Phytophthora nicotianae]
MEVFQHVVHDNNEKVAALADWPCAKGGFLVSASAISMEAVTSHAFASKTFWRRTRSPLPCKTAQDRDDEYLFSGFDGVEVY